MDTCWLIVLAMEAIVVEDFYVIAIVALLPLTSCMVVLQTNPYNALVLRGIVGAVAAMVYALLGGADVALTEALVGTMLAITLYAVAVRSSMCMKLGILADERDGIAQKSTKFIDAPDENVSIGLLLSTLRKTLKKHHLRLELISYPDVGALQAGLRDREVHSTVNVDAEVGGDRPLPPTATAPPPNYQIQTRVKRLYEILEPEATPSIRVSLVDPKALESPEDKSANLDRLELEENLS